MTPWIAAGFLAATAAFSAHAQTDAAPSAKAVHASYKSDAGLEFPAKVQVGDRALVLNGSGMRFRAMFKVYKAALYTEKPAATFAEVTRSSTEGKRIQMVMQREVVSDELGKMFTRGIQDNLDKAKSARLMGAMMRMSDVFTEYKRLEAGDQITLDWVPGTGTVLTVKGKRMAEAIPEPEFFNALVGIWLGASPADWKLRDAMLGVKTVDTAQAAGQR